MTAVHCGGHRSNSVPNRALMNIFFKTNDLLQPIYEHAMEHFVMQCV